MKSTGLVLDMPLSADSCVGTAVYDRRRFRKHGTAANTPNFETRLLTDDAMVFDRASEDMVVVAADPKMDFVNGTKPFTMSIQFKVNDIEATQKSILGKLGYSMGFLCSGTTLRFIVYDDENNYKGTIVSGIAINTWYSVVGIFDGNNIYIYLNGELKDSELSIGGLRDYSAQNFNIGSNTGTSNWFDGTLKNLKIFNYALSAGGVYILHERESA